MGTSAYIHRRTWGVGSEIQEIGEATYAKRYLSFLGEAVDLLEACAGDATLEDTIILFCIYVERFIIDRGIGLRWLGSGGKVLREGGLGFVVRWRRGARGRRRVIVG
jgi:hypothetical protein